MRTANPALNERYFEAEAIDAPRTNVMTVNGTVIRVGVLAAILIAAGGLAWSLSIRLVCRVRRTQPSGSYSDQEH
jgi:hypothetical protein